MAENKINSLQIVLTMWNTNTLITYIKDAPTPGLTLLVKLPRNPPTSNNSPPIATDSIISLFYFKLVTHARYGYNYRN